MARTAAPRFRKTMLALAAGAVVAPCSAWALNLAEAPPGTVEPYVRPNVIISVDDSGSMDWQVTNTNTGSATITTPNADGSWPTNAKRINILKYALTSIFDPTHPQGFRHAKFGPVYLFDLFNLGCRHDRTACREDDVQRFKLLAACFR